MEGGKPLMQALKERQSGRQFSAGKLPLQTLSDLLWAAWGVNRPDGRRTAPSAVNAQEIDLYVTLAEGVFIFDAQAHSLKPVLDGDHRALSGTQPFVAQAPLNLIYVADFAKMRSGTDQEKMSWASAGAGFIGQNVYLFCASEGLATVFRAFVDREVAAKGLGLRADRKVLFAQTVGYPQK
jgi:nitroreductase